MQGVNRKALIQDAVNTRKPLRVPQDFIAALRLTLTLHLDDPSLDVDLVARSSGISRQTLQRLSSRDWDWLLALLDDPPPPYALALAEVDNRRGWPMRVRGPSRYRLPTTKPQRPLSTLSGQRQQSKWCPKLPRLRAVRRT